MQPDGRRGPWRITLDTNPDTCNLRCIMCEEHSPHGTAQQERKAGGRPPRVMPWALVERVLVEGAENGLREVIPSTMGEPLLYEHFDELVELVHRLGLKLNLTTNGTFPRRGARGWAELLVPITSDVKISWNGATAETHERIMLGTRWKAVLDNARDFIAVRDAHASAGGHRCRVTFQLTFLETNVAELPDIVALASELGVDRVKGHHLWSHFKQTAELSMRRTPDSIRRWNQAVVAARKVAGDRVLLENIFELDAAAVTDLAPGGACPFLGQELWVSADGRFDPCCAPDALRRTLGDFGNLKAAPVMELWTSEPYQTLRATYATRPLCRSCNMRRPAVEP